MLESRPFTGCTHRMLQHKVAWRLGGEQSGREEKKAARPRPAAEAGDDDAQRRARASPAIASDRDSPAPEKEKNGKG